MNTFASLRQPRVIGYLCAFIATIVWSSNFIIARNITASVPPVTLALLRWSFALAIALPIAWTGLARDWAKIRLHWRYYVIVSLIGISFFNTALYVASVTVPALNMALIATISPLFTIILARIIYQEPISPAQALGIPLLICGVILLITKGDLSLLTSLQTQAGDLIVLTAALAFAIYTLLVRKTPADVGQFSSLAVTFVLGILFLLPFAAWEIYSLPAFSISRPSWYLIFFLGAGPSVFCFWCWGKAICYVGPTQASIIYYSLPLFCGIEAIIFLDEPIDTIHIISGTLIIGGLLMGTRVKRVPPPATK